MLYVYQLLMLAQEQAWVELLDMSTTSTMATQALALGSALALEPQAQAQGLALTRAMAPATPGLAAATLAPM